MLEPDLHRVVCVLEPHRSARARLRVAIAQSVASLQRRPDVVYVSLEEVNEYAVLDEAKVIRIEADESVEPRCFWFRKPEVRHDKPRKKRKPKGVGMRSGDV